MQPCLIVLEWQFFYKPLSIGCLGNDSVMPQNLWCSRPESTLAPTLAPFVIEMVVRSYLLLKVSGLHVILWKGTSAGSATYHCTFLNHFKQCLLGFQFHICNILRQILLSTFTCSLCVVSIVVEIFCCCYHVGPQWIAVLHHQYNKGDGWLRTICLFPFHTQ